MHTNLGRAALDRWLTTPPDEFGFEIDADRGTDQPADLYDVPSLIDSRDDALSLLTERDAEIAELRTRLAEYRQVNALATAALETYFARYGALPA